MTEFKGIVHLNTICLNIKPRMKHLNVAYFNAESHQILSKEVLKLSVKSVNWSLIYHFLYREWHSVYMKKGCVSDNVNMFSIGAKHLVLISMT